MSNVQRGKYKGPVPKEVENARAHHGVAFTGRRQVAAYEDAVGRKKVEGGEPLLSVEDRLTCPDCHDWKTNHDWKACGLQGKLF